MNSIAIMYSHCLNHRTHVSEKLLGIKGYEYFEHAVDLSKNVEASALVLLAQVELIPVRSCNTHITESGKRFWHVEFIGVCGYAGMFEIDASHALNAQIEMAIAENMKSDFRAMCVYLRSERFYQFRMRLYERAYANVDKFEKTIVGKSAKEVKEAVDAHAIMRVERIKNRIRKLTARTNAHKLCMGGLEFETLMLTRLIEHGFFNLESFKSVAAA